ncbi:hormone receptor 4 isoform X2 [Halyomorpha halys]|uniref:hormone receptor 4 isoform X2 n=2 Tax=Halyomorpha halys TaxID=286706 RepID=UPI0006D51D0F|nr:hormone receptor 4 isoform X2 [Halyomorpha halys]
MQARLYQDNQPSNVDGNFINFPVPNKMRIMTLTRAPCDLDAMSLFQDLKLKRRKVDSRCSSDGESVAETSTSSPELGAPGSPVRPEQTPGSPVQVNRALTPEKSIEVRVKEELVFDGGGPGGFWRSANGRGEMRPPRPAAPRPAPTVIMGEAGGVRTMVWSQPSEQQPGPSTPAWPIPAQEEAAAQLLLTLGQEGSSISPGAVTGSASGRSLNMERLWAGDLSQLPGAQQLTALNLSWAKPGLHQDKQQEGDIEEEDQPMICMICEDKATGLHYGIITCEGCKGFFKRTVQNRRVYTCVADGVCEITKAQRNRCQYCRFKKCIEQGMVLQAVREDRMPGGRNSGAVYNLYKVKYKKHKKSVRNGQMKGQADKGKPLISPEPASHMPPHLVNGTILKTALTNPSEVVHLRQRLDSAVSSSRDRALSVDTTLSVIQTLIDCDEFQDIATLRNLEDLLDHKSDLSDKLMQIGDSIVYKLVQWTKRLPFYLELPVEVHTKLLTHTWHELLVLTTSAYQAIHGAHRLVSTGSDGTEANFTQEVSNNLCTLQTCLTSMMGRPITMDQLRQDVGLMVEKITYVTLMFRRIKLTMQEYVCLKVIIMLNPSRGDANELEAMQERYMTCLRTYVEHSFPNQPNRFHDLLLRLPEVQSAASLLLESKMFYVPFLLNSTIQR